MTRLRPYKEADEAAAIDLWRRTWQVAYPQLDFDARAGWWRERWRNELVPAATIVVAERDGALVGFVTVDRKTGYLDQIVAAPEAWALGVGALLMEEAKRLAPGALELHVNVDNARAIRFYEKHGFAVTGTESNPRSGAPIYRMRWQG